MATNNKTEISQIVGFAILLILGGLQANDMLSRDDTYACEARGIAMPCDSLSKYYSLENGKCINADLGNKLCRSGWINFKEVPEEVSESEPPIQSPPTPSPGKKWLCNP